jgi:outer membrane lipoprotein-sorting protein
MVGMSIFVSRPALRWLVPVAVTVAVVGGGAAARTIAASAEPSLPDRSAAQLLVDLQTADLSGLSGTVRTSADLGLPELPSNAGPGAPDFTGLVTGSRTLRIWYSGPDKLRVALLGTLGESDIIRNGRDMWQWDSRSQQATHRQLPADGAEPQRPDNPNLPKTPQEAADLALKAVDPTTVVSTGTNARVAGRTAYELILAPRDTASLISQVRLAVDSKEHVPLRVQVFAKGHAEPAYEVAFTQISFDRPDDAQFAFNPPPGTKVTEGTNEAPDDLSKGAPANAEKPKVVGTGWTSVVVAKMPPADASKPADPTKPDGGNPANMFLERLPRVSGDWGSGRLLSGRLFSVLLTDDGRVLAGAVAPEKLYEAARG